MVSMSTCGQVVGRSPIEKFCDVASISVEGERQHGQHHISCRKASAAGESLAFGLRYSSTVSFVATVSALRSQTPDGMSAGQRDLYRKPLAGSSLHALLQKAGDVVPASLGESLLDMQPNGCVLYACMNRDLVFKALADPTRRLMLDELSERNEQTLYELTARLIMRHKVAISRQALAKHIDVLEKAGLVISEKRGKYRMLVFNDQPLRAVVNRWLK